MRFFSLFHLQNINLWIKSMMFLCRHSFVSSNFLLKNVLSKKYLNYWYIKIIGILNKEDLNLGNADFLHIASKDKGLESSDVKWWLFLTWNDLKIRVQGLVNKVFDTKNNRKTFKSSRYTRTKPKTKTLFKALLFWASKMWHAANQ